MPTIQEWFKAAENGDTQFIHANCAIFRTATTSDGMTALMIGACCGHDAVVRELCTQEHGCSTASGKTAIHFGLDSDNWEVVSIMLPYEASVRNVAGDTLLHWAVRVRARTCMTKLLMQFSTAVNGDGLTAVQLAKSLNYNDLLPLLNASSLSGANESVPPPVAPPAFAMSAAPAPPTIPGTKPIPIPTAGQIVPETIPRPGDALSSSIIQPPSISSGMPMPQTAALSVSAYQAPVLKVRMSASSILPTNTGSYMAGGTVTCEKCAKLTQQSKELTAELDRIKEQNTSLLAQYQTAMEAMTSTQTTNATFMAQITESQAIISRLESELEKHKMLVKNSSTESANLMSQMSASTTQVTALQNELRLKDEEIRMLRTKVSELEENTTEIIRMTESAINARATITANQLATQLEERATLQSKVSHLETENTELHAKLAASQSAVDSLIQSQTAAQEQNNNLLRTITDLNTRMAQFSNDNAVSSKRIAELEEQISGKTTEITEMRKQLTMLRSGILDGAVEGASPSTTSVSRPSSEFAEQRFPGTGLKTTVPVDQASSATREYCNNSPNMATMAASYMGDVSTMDRSTIGKPDVPAFTAEQRGESSIPKSTSYRDKDGNTAFILAAAAGDLATVLSLVSYQEKVTNTTGETALMKAAENGHLDVVHALLDRQAGKSTYSGKTALMSAALNGHTSICQLLVPHEAGLARKDGWTALMSAARNNHMEIVKLLIDKEARRQTKDGTTALIKAIEHGNLEVVKTLAPIELDLTLRGGATALMKCKRTEYPEMYSYLKSLQD